MLIVARSHFQIQSFVSETERERPFLGDAKNRKSALASLFNKSSLVEITFLKMFNGGRATKELQSKHKKSAKEDEEMFEPNLGSQQVCPLCYLSRFQRHTTARTSIPAEEGKQQSVGLPLTSRLPPSLSRVHHRTLECSVITA